MAGRGFEGWSAAVAARFGAERLADLEAAIRREHEHVCFLNPFLSEAARAAVAFEYRLTPNSIAGTYNFDIPEDPTARYGVDESADDRTVFVEATNAVTAALHSGLTPFFFVEGASVIAAHALDANPGHRVLSMCSGLGGGALTLAVGLFARDGLTGRNFCGRLVANEPAKERAARMQRCMRGFLPSTLLNEDARQTEFVVFTSADAGTPSNSMERHAPFDKILLEAPSTDDRGLLRGDAGQMERWSAGMLKVSAERQVKWLYNALWLLREGGDIVFTSRGLSREESDGVVEALVRKAHGNFNLQVLPLQPYVRDMIPSRAGEQTDWGTYILPDSSGFGPLFFSRIRLVNRTHALAQPIQATNS